MNISRKYTYAGRIFLISYLFFLAAGVFHYHHYDLSSELALQGKSLQGTASDLDSDKLLLCSLHQFIQSVAHLSYTADAVKHDLSLLKIGIPDYSNGKLLFVDFCQASPRAPPSFS